MEIQVPTRDRHKKVAGLKPSLAEYSVQQQIYVFLFVFFYIKHDLQSYAKMDFVGHRVIDA